MALLDHAHGADTGAARAVLRQAPVPALRHVGEDFRPRTAYPELDCIRDRLPVGLAEWSERRASSLATGADRVLITAGVIEEDEYLRAFADAAGIAFAPLDRTPRTACPLTDDRLIDAVAAGILPLRQAGELVYVVAPRGIAARRLAEFAARYADVRRRIRVTSAARLQSFVTRHAGNALGERAAEALRKTSPMLSAARRPWRTRWRPLAVLAALATTVAIAPAAATVATNVTLSLVFLAWMVLRLLGPLAWRPATRHRVPITNGQLPVYTVVAAIYREAASVGGLVDALRGLDWPPEKLDVKIVVEADDADTRAALAELDLDPRFDIIVAPEAGPRTKPKALNAALPFARGTFTVIYDAEDRPEPDQLRAAVDAFLSEPPDLACVQAALTIDNTDDSWLARLFTAEYAAHFDVFLPSLAALRVPLPLGGSSNHFRTAALRAIGGWDPYNVTEDADLGIRLARFGYRTTVISSTTYEEAPAKIGPWLRQRTRWFKGWMQTWLVHMRTPGQMLQDLGVGGFLIFQLIIGGNVLAALIYPVFAALVAWRAALGEPVLDSAIGGLYAVTLLGGLLTTALTGAIGLARRGLLASAWVVLFAPAHWLLLSVAVWRGLAQLLRDPYRWEKTEHGLARSSRRRRS